MKKNALHLLVALVCSYQLQAQQYKWGKNNGAGGTMTAQATSISVNTNNETWVTSSGGTVSASQIYGAGGSPDLGPREGTNYWVAKYDANMNRIWSTGIQGLLGTSNASIVADPYNPNQFYMAWTVSASSTSFGGIAFTGQPSRSSVVIAKCSTSSTGTLNYIWLRKIDGNSDDVVGSLKLKDLGSGKVRLAVLGSSRSTDISNYTSGTTGIAQTVAISGGGATAYDWFISCWEDNSGIPTPLWINTFGNSIISENGRMPLEINDAGDVLFAPYYAANSIGLANYDLNNNSGGTTYTTSYSVNINGSNRYILFTFNGTNGTIKRTFNELATNRNWYPRGIATDTNKNIFLYGYLSGTYNVSSTVSLASAGSFDAAVIVFDSSYVPLRAQRYGGVSANYQVDIPIGGFALDRKNNRIYITGTSNGSFSSGTAAVQQVNGYDGFLLCTEAYGLMSGISAVSFIGTLPSSRENFGAVDVRPDGKVIAAADFVNKASYKLNADTTSLMPRTAYGYQDVAVTCFDGTSSTLLNPLAGGGFGGLTSSSINITVMNGSKLLSGGSFFGEMTVDGSTISSGTGSQGGLLLETDTATGLISSVRTILGNVVIRNIKINPADGSIYLLVMATGSTAVFGNPATHASLGGWDPVLIKLDASYKVLWKTRIGGTETDNGNGLELDNSGNIYISGQFDSPNLRVMDTSGVTSAILAYNNNPGPSNTSDIYVAKFNSSGTLQWLKTGGSNSSTFSDASLKGLQWMDGYLYFGGTRANDGTTFSFGGKTLASSSAGTSDMFVAKLDPATGNATWLKSWAGNGAEVINSLTTYDHKIYIGGQSSSTSGLSLGGISFTTAGSSDAFVFAIDDAGTEQAGLVQLKGNGADIIYEIKADLIGNIFFAGATSSTSMPISGVSLGTSGGNDWLVGSIDAENMVPKFGFISGSANNEDCYTITSGLVGMAFAGGTLRGPATFGTAVANARLGGDFCYARIDYPYLAPGAQVSNLTTWYKSNALLTGSPATAWGNSTSNPNLTTLTNTGSVSVDDADANYNPALSINSSSNYMSRDDVYAGNFMDASGSRYTIYSVYKPSALTDNLNLWNESSTGTSLSMGASSSNVSGTGGARTITKTNPLTIGQYQLDVLVANNGTLSALLNGKVNGSATGATPVKTTNGGKFQTHGTGNFDVAEILVYGGAHTTGQAAMNQINSYFGIKYGITLAHNYYSSIGDTLYNVDGAGTAYLYDNNIAAIGIDSNQSLIQKQSRSQNIGSKGNMLTIAMDSVFADNMSNTAIPGPGLSYLVWGDNADSVSAVSTIDMPSGVGPCAFRLPREWKINRKGSGISQTEVQFDINGTITTTGLEASDFKLQIDRDGDGNFSTGSITSIAAFSFSGGIVRFNKVNWDTDNNGTDVFALIVDQAPDTPAFATPLTYCQYAATAPLLAIGAATTDTILWYSSASGGIGSTLAPTPTSAIVGSTVYYVSIKSALGCESSRFPFTVNINPTPHAPIVTTPINLCEGGPTVGLSASSGTSSDTLFWYNAATGGVGTPTPPTLSTTLTGTDIYYVSSKNTYGCEGPRAAITVNINELPPAPSVVTPVKYCVGEVASALSATGTDLSWYNSATGGTASTSAPVPATSVSGTTIYYVTQKSAASTGSCESSRAAISVNINPIPDAPTVTTPVTYCQEAIATALTATGTNLSWYTLPGGTSSSVAPVPSTATPGISTYYVSQKTTEGCESELASISVTVNPLPSLPIVVSPVTYCQEEIATPLSATGTALLWYNSSIGGTSSAVAPTPGTMYPGTTTYYVSQTSSLGCEGHRAAINVVINPIPSQPSVVTPVAYCQDAVASALTATGTNLSWYTAASGGSPSSIAPTPITSTSGTFSYYVSQKTALGCEGPRAEINVNINPLPDKPVVVSPVNYCQGVTSVPLSATGTDLKWYTALTGGSPIATPIPSTTTLGSTNYYVSQTSDKGCEGHRAVILVNVNPLPTVNITPVGVPDFVYCEGRKVKLRANSVTAVSYQWQTSGAIIPGETSNEFSTGTSGYFGVIVTNIFGCKQTDSVYVRKDTLPAPKLSPTDISKCADVAIKLYVTPKLSEYLTYEWEKDGSILGGITEPVTPVISGGTYSVSVTNIFTCVKSTNASVVNSYPEVAKPTIVRADPLLKLDKIYSGYQWFRNGVAISGATKSTYLMAFDGKYFATVFDVNGCSKNSDTVEVVSLGINNSIYQDSIKIYPNPTQNVVNIDAPIKINVIVTDITGKLILESFNTTSIDMSGYSDGTYIMKILNDRNEIISVQKINKLSYQ